MRPEGSPAPGGERESLTPDDGWHAVHLFYHIDQSNWSLLSQEEQREAKIHLTELAQEIRTHPETQLLTSCIVTPKADLGFFLLTPDLHDANEFEKRLTLSLGAETLSPVFSYLSVLHTPTTLPDWPVASFFPLHPRHDAASVALENTLRQLLPDASESVQTVVTSSSGLDDGEFGLTFFAQNTTALQSQVTALRTEPRILTTADFGELYLGIQLPLDELFRRTGL